MGNLNRLQNNYDKALKESQQLLDENESLRNRLRDVVNSPLSDAEKQQIIDDSQRLHSSAPASIALPNVSGSASNVANEEQCIKLLFAFFRFFCASRMTEKEVPV